MALSSTIKTLLNKFADSMGALRIPGQPLQSSNPQLGDVLDAAIEAAAGSSSAAAAAASASDASDSADAAAASAASAANASYTPAVTGNWTGADPTTLKGAIDRIAAALGPIA